MFKVDILAVGALKNSPLLDLWNDYLNRLQWRVALYEFDDPADDKILKKISKDALVVALDERGKNIGSRDFANQLQEILDSGCGQLQFILGGADGLSQDVRDQADLILSFGQLTWPHKLARVMLAEQLYRAQQIMAGHPYHRD